MSNEPYLSTLANRPVFLVIPQPILDYHLAQTSWMSDATGTSRISTHVLATLVWNIPASILLGLTFEAMVGWATGIANSR